MESSFFQNPLFNVQAQATRYYEEAIQVCKESDSRIEGLSKQFFLALQHDSEREARKITQTINTKISQMREMVQKVTSAMVPLGPEKCSRNVCFLEDSIQKNREIYEGMCAELFEKQFQKLSLDLQRSEPKDKLLGAFVSLNESVRQQFPEYSLLGKALLVKMHDAKVSILKSVLEGSLSFERTDRLVAHILVRLHCDEVERKELFKSFFQLFHAGAAQHLRAFRIERESDRIELAKFCARVDGGNTAWSISDFDLLDQEALVELALLCARDDPLKVATMTVFCELPSEVDRFRIAKFCVQKGAPFVSVYSLLRITNPELREKIYKESGMYDPATSPINEDWLRSVPALAEIEAELNELKKEIPPDSQALEKLNDWLFRTKIRMALVYDATKLLLPHEFIQAVFRHRNPEQRDEITRKMAFVCTGGSLPIYRRLCGERPAQYKILPAVLVAELESRGVPNCQTFLDAFPRYHDEGAQVPVVLRTLLLLCKESRLTPEDTGHILLLLTANLRGNAKQKSQQVIQRCLNILILIANDMVEKLEKPYIESHGNNLSIIFEGIFQEFFPALKNIPNLFERYALTFALFRQPTALFTYQSVLKRVPGPDRSVCDQSLELYARSVLEGTFSTMRYDRADSLHLQTVMADPIVAQEWKKGGQAPFEPVAALLPPEQEPASQFNFFDFLKQKLGENHWRKEQCQDLDRYVQGQVALPEAVASLQHQALETQNLTSQQRDHIQLQLHCLHLCEGRLSPQGRLELLKQMVPLAAGLEFQNDIRHAIASYEGLLHQTAANFKDWKIVDSDDPCDLLLAVTEVTGSCQRISGDPDLNKCLLGYLLDGENRLLAVKDAQGKIVARRIFRILWDAQDRRPVLFIERPYTVGTVSEEVLRALDTFAQQRAEALHLPLLTADEGTRSYGHSVQALGGRAPYVYSDGAQGVCPRGIFTVESPMVFSSR